MTNLFHVSNSRFAGLGSLLLAAIPMIALATLAFTAGAVGV